MGAWRMVLVGGTVAGIVLSGCSLLNRSQGDSKKTDMPSLSEAVLGRVVLSDGDLVERHVYSRYVNPTTKSANDLTTEPGHTYSPPNCLGAIHTGRLSVYLNRGVTVVRTQLSTLPFKEVTVDQAAVLFGSTDGARNFLDASRSQWADCANSTVTLEYDKNGRQTHVTWKLGEFAGGTIITLNWDSTSAQQDCQHAMGAVSNLVAEAIVCSGGLAPNDDGEKVVRQMLDNAASATGTG